MGALLSLTPFSLRTSVYCFLALPLGLQNPVHAAVLAVILLVSKTVCAVLDNIFASAHATAVGDRLLYHPVPPSLSSSAPLRDLIEARIILRRTLDFWFGGSNGIAGGVADFIGLDLLLFHSEALSRVSLTEVVGARRADQELWECERFPNFPNTELSTVRLSYSWMSASRTESWLCSASSCKLRSRGWSAG